MTALTFLAPRPATSTFEPRLTSPLERALVRVPLGIELADLSLTLAKFEVRGGIDACADHDLIRISPSRGLVVCAVADAATVEPQLRERVDNVVDVTGALAALRIAAPDAETLVRRLTDLDLARLPAAGAVAHVAAVLRRVDDAFEIYWPQEYGHYLAEVVVDAAIGLGKRVP